MNNRPKISNVTYFKFPIYGAETNLEYVKVYERGIDGFVGHYNDDDLIIAMMMMKTIAIVHPLPCLCERSIDGFKGDAGVLPVKWQRGPPEDVVGMVEQAGNGND